MVAPTVHIGGTSPSQLLDAYMGARCALLDALEALAQTAPNGRDFPGPALAVAQAEHVARVNAVVLVASEMLAICEAIQGQDR